MKTDIDIDACKQGDRAALGKLYTAYSDRLLRICRRYVKDEDAAEDVLHDAFIIIFSSIGNLRDDARLEGWMKTIVRNLALRYLQGIGQKEVPLSFAGEVPVSEEGQETDRHADVDVLLAAIDALPGGSGEVFRLSVLDGLSHKEIAILLGIAPHSSSSQLSRAKRQLRMLLSDYWPFLLLPVLIPLCIYIMVREKPGGSPRRKPVAVKTRKRGIIELEQPEKELPTDAARERAEEVPVATHTAHGTRVLVEYADTSGRMDAPDREELAALPGRDTLSGNLAISVNVGDSLPRLPQLRADRLQATHVPEPVHERLRRKYPWNFGFGFSSSDGSSGSVIDNDYLSVIDYASGGSAAKIHTIGEYADYLERNRMLLDSAESARMQQIVDAHDASSAAGIGERKYHFRPKSLSISLNRRLDRHWILGTGLSYTRLKSEFVSDFNKATLRKTQKIDYVGIPLRLTYRVWDKGRFSAYAIGGVAFEMPVHSSLSKEFVVTSDSSFTLRGKVHPRIQWSVGLGVGVQYRLSKPFSLYLEPSMLYHFRNGNGVETYWTEHPFTVTVPFGLRLTW
ncbi:MAG: sigma-70 family RNA polymerase sigma factor [Prevotella sp.]|nr:sigma-70 family RNA polymerase sigma factor [Prevotella sp.]